MYSSAKEGNSNAPPPDAGKFIRLGVIALIAIAAFAIVGSQAVTLFMNYEEFGDLFTTPLYFSLVSGHDEPVGSDRREGSQARLSDLVRPEHGKLQ